VGSVGICGQFHCRQTCNSQCDKVHVRLQSALVTVTEAWISESKGKMSFLTGTCRLGRTGKNNTHDMGPFPKTDAADSVLPIHASRPPFGGQRDDPIGPVTTLLRTRTNTTAATTATVPRHDTPQHTANHPDAHMIDEIMEDQYKHKHGHPLPILFGFNGCVPRPPTT
jgi:hypothetical protein